MFHTQSYSVTLLIEHTHEFRVMHRDSDWSPESTTFLSHDILQEFRRSKLVPTSVLHAIISTSPSWRFNRSVAWYRWKLSSREAGHITRVPDAHAIDDRLLWSRNFTQGVMRHSEPHVYFQFDTIAGCSLQLYSVMKSNPAEPTVETVTVLRSHDRFAPTSLGVSKRIALISTIHITFTYQRNKEVMVIRILEQNGTVSDPSWRRCFPLASTVKQSKPTLEPLERVIPLGSLVSKSVRYCTTLLHKTGV